MAAELFQLFVMESHSTITSLTANEIVVHRSYYISVKVFTILFISFCFYLFLIHSFIHFHLFYSFLLEQIVSDGDLCEQMGTYISIFCWEEHRLPLHMMQNETENENALFKQT